MGSAFFLFSNAIYFFRGPKGPRHQTAHNERISIPSILANPTFLLFQ